MSNKKTNKAVTLQQHTEKKGHSERNASAWKKKLGDYLVDISKYVLTGVIISSMFNDLAESPGILYGWGAFVSFVTLTGGLILVGKFSKEK